MKREDLAFVVSRGLAVWVAMMAVVNLAEIPGILGAMRSAAILGGGQGTPSILPVLVTQFTMLAGEIAVAIILWTKADKFCPRGIEAESATPSIDATALRCVLLSGFGVLMFVQSGMTIFRGLIERREFATFFEAYSRSPYDWRGAAIEAAFGAAIFLWFSYGPHIRHALGYFGD